MKVVLFTQDEPFYLPSSINKIVEEKNPAICGLVILSPLAIGKSKWQAAKKLYNFYGPAIFVYNSIMYSWYKFLSNLSGKIPLRRVYSVENVAKRHNILVYKPNDINSPEFISILRQIMPDVIVSIAASQVFKKNLLELPRHGCINVHGGMLPKYRGLMPSFWAMVNNEPEIGVTVHYMGDKLDSGDIILQRTISIDDGDSLHSLISKSKKMAAELIIETLSQIERGTVRTTPNLKEHATYFSFPTKEDRKRFRKQGLRFR